MHRAIALVCVLGAVACGRPPGPHEDERGDVTYWIINDSTAARTGCSDGRGYADLELNKLEYTPGISWYFIYQLSEDGNSAVFMDCKRESFNDCTRRENLVLRVIGHELAISDPPVVLETFDGCQLEMRERLLLTDKGTRGVGEERLLFEFVGDAAACDAAEAKIRAEAPNGLGLRDCQITATHKAVFSHVRKPR